VEVEAPDVVLLVEVVVEGQALLLGAGGLGRPPPASRELFVYHVPEMRQVEQVVQAPQLRGVQEVVEQTVELRVVRVLVMAKMVNLEAVVE